MLLIFPEPGELEQDKLRAAWSQFALDYGWIVAVVNSGNPRRWTGEELQLAGRVLGRLKNGYAIDPARTAFMGLGVGGRVALLAANMQPDKVSAAILVGTEVERFRIRGRNSPLRSLDYLLIGERENLQPTADLLNGKGYAATVISGVGLEPQKLETHPQAQIERWLEGLARY
jgi:pimeloyl-ACP methyl ester carboxylesterase